VLRAAHPIFQAAGLGGVIQSRRFRGQAPAGTPRGPSNPYRRQIPSFAYGSVGENWRSTADLAAPEVAGVSLVRRTCDISQ
jgi:hypothetical protein